MKDRYKKEKTSHISRTPSLHLSLIFLIFITHTPYPLCFLRDKDHILSNREYMMCKKRKKKLVHQKEISKIFHAQNQHASYFFNFFIT